MSREFAHCGERNVAHDEPRGEGMPQVREVEIKQPGSYVCVLERVAGIGDPVAVTVMEPKARPRASSGPPGPGARCHRTPCSSSLSRKLL